MPKIAPTEIAAFLDLTNKPMAAKSAPEFFEAVRESFETLRARLMSKESRSNLRALEQALNTCPSLRQRRLLDVCCAPVFDKPAVPAGAVDGVPEFLWLFCMPVVVQFSQAQVHRGVTLPADAVDARAVLRACLEANVFNEKALLTGFPTLLSRDDLHVVGPANLAKLFIAAEFGGASSVDLTPSERQFDPEIESGRVTTLFLLGAARLPAGERSLMRDEAVWPRERIAHLVGEGLQRHDIEVERIASHPAASLTEAMFRCTTAGADEMQTVLALAKSHYGIKEIVLLQSLDGMADLTGVDGEGEEYVLCPPIQYVEPWSAVRNLMEMTSEAAGLSFKSASLATPTSSMTH